MFRTMGSERHGQSSSCPAGRGDASAGLVSQESSWIGLLSRPAMTFLQSYLPGRPVRAPSRSDAGTGWNRGDLQLKTSFVDAESDFLRQLDDLMPLNVTHHPGAHMTVLRCQNAGAAALLEPRAGGSVPGITADSLRELGIQSAEGMDLNYCHQQTHESGYLSSAWTFLSHVLISSVSSQENAPPAGKEWGPAGASVTGSVGKSRTWWDSFWGGEESSQRWLLYLPRAGTAPTLCPQKQPTSETKPPKTSGEGWTLGENTGVSQHKEQSGNNGGLHTAQNTKWVGVRDHRSRLGAGAAAAGSVAALLSPETDSGYSRPEEEHLQVCRLKMLSEDQQETEDNGLGTETSEDAESGVTSGQEVEEEEAAAAPDASAEDPCAATPHCQNKAIAFIMGCPCSDDSQSDESSDDDDDDDDDDDGFDSEGLSDRSDSSDDEDDEDDEDSDSEADSEPDSEAERLWRSLCHSVDPYNPRNFTAQLPAARTPPRAVPAVSPLSSTQSSPASSPPSGADVWDDSASASEADEAESVRLLNSFGCSSDPYSPFNFQAPLRTRGPAGAPPGTRAGAQAPPKTSCRPDAAFPPEYRTEEAEERLDSGFSEFSTQSCSVTKKVRFCDDVEEFFASCGEEDEDRRGPWEELARDRCRFLRRCRDTEQSIAYVLQPQHRRRVWRRLTAAAARSAQDA